MINVVVRPDRTNHVQFACPINASHYPTVRFSELYSDSPDASARASYQYLLSGLDVRSSEKIDCMKSTRRDNRCLFVGHVRWLDSYYRALLETVVLGVCPEMQACESENLVALLEPRYISACRFYFSGQLLAENLPSRRSDAKPNSEKKLPFERNFETAQLAVPHRYRRGVDPH